MIQLTRTVAAELTDSGVQVNCICPGDIGVSMPGQVSKAAGVAEPPASQAEAGLKRMPRAELAQGVAQAAVWLASDAAGSATGHALVVDGGPDCRTAAAGQGPTRVGDAVPGFRR